MECIKQKPIQSIITSIKEPEMYFVCVRSFGYPESITVWGNFSAKLSELFSVPEDKIRKDIKLAVEECHKITVGIYTKEIAETLIQKANHIVCQHLCQVPISFICVL